MQIEDIVFLKKHEKPFSLGLDIGARNVNGTTKQYIKGNIIGIDLKKDKYVDVVASAEYLPFRNNVFDSVFCMNVIEHSDNPLMVFSETNRVSANQSRIYFSIPMPNFPYHSYPKDKWRVTWNGNDKNPCLFLVSRTEKERGLSFFDKLKIIFWYNIRACFK